MYPLRGLMVSLSGKEVIKTQGAEEEVEEIVEAVEEVKT